MPLASLHTTSTDVLSFPKLIRPLSTSLLHYFYLSHPEDSDLPSVPCFVFNPFGTSSNFSSLLYSASQLLGVHVRRPRWALKISQLLGLRPEVALPEVFSPFEKERAAGAETTPSRSSSIDSGAREDDDTLLKPWTCQTTFDSSTCVSFRRQ